MLPMLLTVVLMANLQPTTLGGYAPATRVEETVKGELIISIETTDNNGWCLSTTSFKFFTDEYGIIIAVNSDPTGEDIYIQELGLKLPCSSKSVLEIMGMPDNIKDVSKTYKRKVYVYSYQFGSRGYALGFTVEEDKAIFCTLYSFTNLKHYLPKYW